MKNTTGDLFGPYLLTKTLGEGACGKVKLGKHRESGEEVAVKLIHKGVGSSKLTNIESIKREIDILKSVQHPSIIKLIDVIEINDYMGIVLEYIPGGELLSYVERRHYLDEVEACRLFKQLIQGVDYLHQGNILYRDLKLENLLLDAAQNLIITDFGFARKFEDSDRIGSPCGTPYFLAPEILQEGLYAGRAADIWSCGIILYIMLVGAYPFNSNEKIEGIDGIRALYAHISATTLTFPEHISSEAEDLLRMMLVVNPTDRCDMEMIKSHSVNGIHKSSEVLLSIPIRKRPTVRITTGSNWITVPTRKRRYNETDNNNDDSTIAELRKLKKRVKVLETHIAKCKKWENVTTTVVGMMAGALSYGIGALIFAYH
ncbi:3859_t:CDS:2 [Diversispora eburnea]|uniref:3859_t:CDS:1 n=1 Tax=Diversispora eburnea TaxID=1213867 RepID=A0A9N9B0Q6_9GLOM|nr:3859_t:CDS:2 [Diversispora eburnea]